MDRQGSGRLVRAGRWLTRSHHFPHRRFRTVPPAEALEPGRPAQRNESKQVANGFRGGKYRQKIGLTPDKTGFKVKIAIHQDSLH